MRIIKKLKSLISFSIIALLLVGTVLVIKNVLLHQVRKKIQSSFNYSQLQLSFFPAALIMENAKTHSQNPFFSAEKIVVKISLKSLLTRKSPFNVYIEHPILRILSVSKDKDQKDKTRFDVTLPIVVQKGLIKDGEFYFQGKEVGFSSVGINALFVQRKEHFSIHAETKESVFSQDSSQKKIRGKVSLTLDSRGREIAVKKVQVDGPDFILKAKGKFFDPFNPEFELDTYLNAKTDLLIDLFHLPFEWEGKTEANGFLTRKKEEIICRADFSISSRGLSPENLSGFTSQIGVSQVACEDFTLTRS